MQLSNSFLLVMGDHGFRFGGIRGTKTGEAEDRNPLLMLVLPEHLRNHPQLLEQLRSNARHLTTHFDVFATLIDIAQVSFRLPFLK